MSDFRFDVGDPVLCNLGEGGWKLGRIIALCYREDHWPEDRFAPYQVALDDDHALIYVPEDDDRYCRAATREDFRFADRLDALATFSPTYEATESQLEPSDAVIGSQLSCADGATHLEIFGYRDGRCHGCSCCPRSWSAVELYSEHYRCAERNGLKVTRIGVDIGRVRVGDSVQHTASDRSPSQVGFMQCPTLVRLPPGIRFSDDGALAGEVRFDPYRGVKYRVEFVAVSTAKWDDPAVGIVRLEIAFTVEGNEPPDEFDLDAFLKEQQQARDMAHDTLGELSDTWERWEQGQLSNRETYEQMLAQLRRLRELLDRHPRLDGGRWWAQLGGFHMNVHKLLENTLFQCELYLGHALTFGDPDVRWIAEQNLKGCYHKRLLEAARFLWIDGLEQMMRGEWAAAAETLRRAAAKKDGWGWAVNNGDIWFSEAAARLVHGAELAARDPADDGDSKRWIADATRLLEQGVARAEEGEMFGPDGHPWASEIESALLSYRNLPGDDGASAEWLRAFKLRTTYWCAQVLGGAAPFPPKPRPRREDPEDLVRRLPGHNE